MDAKENRGDLWENVRDLVTSGTAPYIRCLFWSLAILPDGKHKDLAADMLADLGILCLDVDNEPMPPVLVPGHKKCLLVFINEGMNRTRDLWRMLAHHGIADPKEGHDKAVSAMIVLSIVILAREGGKPIYVQTIHSTWAPQGPDLASCAKMDVHLARLYGDVTNDCPKIMQFLLSRISIYEDAHLMLFITATLMIALFYAFFIDWKGEERFLHVSGLTFRLVHDASRILVEHDSLFFRCMGAHLYMLLHSFCQEDWQRASIGERIDPNKHKILLLDALKIARDVCQDPPTDVFEGEWSLRRRMSFTDVTCTIKNTDARALALVYIHTAILDYASTINAWQWLPFLDQHVSHYAGIEVVFHHAGFPHAYGTKDAFISGLTDAFQNCSSNMDGSEMVRQQECDVSIEFMNNCIKVVVDFATLDTLRCAFTISDLVKMFKVRISNIITTSDPSKNSSEAPSHVAPLASASMAEGPSTSTSPKPEQESTEGSDIQHTRMPASAEKDLKATPKAKHVDPDRDLPVATKHTRSQSLTSAAPLDSTGSCSRPELIGNEWATEFSESTPGELGNMGGQH